MSERRKKNVVFSFHPTFWLVILFEFFERGAYYGMMSFLSVYMTDQLHFAKESVGLIKGTIQPLLYFLPIVSGALADRFGYRRTLMVAFSFLGLGYFLTSQTTTYTAVFLSLVVMGIGAGTFKPIISGSIARLTDKSNSTMGFGIYYWSINLGAFLFPLILVPILKNSIGPRAVILASALATGSMIIPTLFIYKEPRKINEKRDNNFDLLQTLSNAFEIIYSPFILLFKIAQKSAIRKFLIYGFVLVLVVLSGWLYVSVNHFFLGFVSLLLVASFAILSLLTGTKTSLQTSKMLLVLLFALIGILTLWLLPGVSTFTRILTTIIYITVLSIFQINLEEADRFVDNLKFLLMICIYSGFWILYFQMFDSVLWYVKDYVDATPLNNFVNGILGAVGININWFFDVEHVTVINAGTIILLQLIISNIVKHTKALPTMITGILFGTLGMAILAISPSIWVFVLGIIIFSVGEMTAHPKFISYVGLIAPRDRVATYMGYIFLYGVIGSSVGAIVGAKLYVHFVDTLNQPKTLWLIFSGIGLATIAGLLLYNRFIAPEKSEEA